MESYLFDQKVLFDQEKEIRKNTDLLCDLGSIKPCHIEEYLKNEFNNKISFLEPFSDNESLILGFRCKRNQTLLMGLEDNTNLGHIVRISGFDDKGNPLEIMDPALQLQNNNKLKYYANRGYKVTALVLLSYKHSWLSQILTWIRSW